MDEFINLEKNREPRGRYLDDVFFGDPDDPDSILRVVMPYSVAGIAQSADVEGHGGQVQSHVLSAG
jgi:hypothetical protein